MTKTLPPPAQERSPDWDYAGEVPLILKDVGVTGVEIAPAQISVQFTTEDGVVRVVRVRHGEHA
ncbi:hypothetical protein Q0Z83_041690 [Actinoplanes sichuanensis]|nr:hypothetical protein Q0Z83_041690 [Actinoplanes sichuanensis]